MSISASDSLCDYRLYCDTRLGGEPRYSTGRPDDADMEVPKNISECTCFISVRQEGRLRPKATAFFVSVPADLGTVEGGYLYLVTAKHCVERAKRFGSIFIRLNTKFGDILHHEIKSEWIYPQEEGPDVAVLPFEAPADAELKAVPIGMLATKEKLSENRIGIGDDVAVTGLFAKVPGNSRNVPVLRGGMISAMPGEALTGSDGKEYLAYLIEMRSVGGLSGSPVFVVKTAFVDPNKKTPNFGLQLSSYVFLLIGLIRGHWDQANVEDAEDDSEGRETLNTGIAVATPIQECLYILNGEELVRQRRQSDLEWRIKNAALED